MIHVSREEVARYYIECELENIADGDGIHMREGAYHSNMMRLLEALSFTYRANFVFDYIAGDTYRWERRDVSVASITLTGMSGYLTGIIYGDEVQQNPHLFAEYIRRHLDDARLAELHTASPIPENRQTIMLRESDGKIKMVDGSHRLMAMVMSGATAVPAYVGVIADPNAKPFVGDTVFLRLLELWRYADTPEYKHAIEQTVIGMIRSTVNGAESVQAYWVNMAPNEEIRMVGERLLGGLRI